MINRKDRYTIRQIAQRAADVYGRVTHDTPDWRYIASELELVHDEVVALRLDDMLAGTDFDLMHDVSGIHRHLDIGKERISLMRGFLPRYAEL